MVQFNLLPDIKLEYIKSQRTKHLVTFIATLAGLISIGLLLFSMFVVYVVQDQYIKALTKDISKYTTELKDTPDINKMLTVQNQLSRLTKLHEEKNQSSRLFSYIQQTTPAKTNLNKLKLDYADSSLTLGGTAPNLDEVKVYTNALKAARYTAGSSESTSAFKDVVLSSFSRDTKGANFTITTKFDPVLFNLTQNVQLEVKATANGTQANPFGEGN